MATVREHVRISRSPDDVWKVVSDAGAIASWFPAIEESSADGSARTCTMAGGVTLVEEIVTKDDELRRFQYRITEAPFPVDFHLGTVDVLDDPGGSLVVYSTDVEPGDSASVMGPALQNALGELKRQLEAGADERNR